MIGRRARHSIQTISSCTPDRWRAPLQVEGIAKLDRDLPSTAAIGNATISAALSRLDAARPLAVTRLLGQAIRGSKSPPQVAVRARDEGDAAAAEVAWSALRTAFAQPESVLLLHTHNHYALIFALREWDIALVPGRGADVPGRGLARQLLTARKGQRPSAWVDLEEILQLCRNWSGHCVTHVRVRPPLAGGVG